MHASARKIPHLRLLAWLVLGTSSPGWGAQAPDSTRIYRAAHEAEIDYERAARRLAPLSYPDRARRCDEYVGRFCLYYDTGRDPLPPEPTEIARARQRALERLRNAFEINRARKATVFPLVRLLLEHKQPREAHEVVQAYQAVTDDVVSGELLAVLTAHATADIRGAERAIDELLASVNSAEAQRLRDISFLLAPRERKRYRELAPDQQRRYEDRFWRYADALYLTEGNETRTEHFARHTETKLLETVPFVQGGSDYGKDIAQLTIRFGTPKARTRVDVNRPGTYDLQIVEHWDPEQMIYAAPSLDSALTVRASPGAAWPMDTVRSISGHAPSTIRRMLPLHHQPSVFHDAGGGFTLRVDGLLLPDSAQRGATRLRRGLFLLDDTLALVARVNDETSVSGDTLPMTLELPLPREAVLYSAEVLEPDRGLAGRARFRLDRPVADRGLLLSDVVIADAFPPGQLPASRHDSTLAPKRSLLVPAGSPFGIYAEVSLGIEGPDSVVVDLEVIALDGGPALVRAARWIGERLGLSDRPVPRKLTWAAEIPTATPTPVAVTVESANLKPGRYVVELSVTSRARRVTSRREFVLIDSATSSRRP
jgi:hypothetical protein